MSNIKSFQRLLVVQALYELSINENRSQTPIKEIFANIVKESNYSKKMNSSNLNFAKEIYEGVMKNLDDINNILKVSININKAKKDIIITIR